MREQFRSELQMLNDHLVEMTRLVGEAVGGATVALLRQDLHRAEAVIGGDATIDSLSLRVESTSYGLLVRQQPVATELRVVMTALRIGSELERMGDLAAHLAKQARMRYPRHALPAELEPVFAAMGSTAQDIVTKTGQVISSRDLALAAELEDDDDVMDRLHRELFERLLDPAWPHGVEAAVDVTLCSRYYERFADHAVSVARRVGFLVTGRWPTPGSRSA